MQKLSRYGWRLLWAFLFFLLFLLQGTGWLTVRPLHANPMILLPFLVIFSMYHRELSSALTGLAVGIFLDSLSVSSTGFHSIFFFLTGLTVSLIAHYYFNKNIRSAILLSLIFCLCYYFARFFFFFLLRGNFTDGTYYLFRTALPSFIYTNLFSVPFFYLHHIISLKAR
ncbi:MAG: rod shape-determining protein MreD [Clostridia bacterium]|nr:rod shape-determining protein MreD [Clostridia bacterium]